MGCIGGVNCQAEISERGDQVKLMKSVLISDVRSRGVTTHGSLPEWRVNGFSRQKAFALSASQCFLDVNTSIIMFI